MWVETLNLGLGYMLGYELRLVTAMRIYAATTMNVRHILNHEPARRVNVIVQASFVNSNQDTVNYISI